MRLTTLTLLIKAWATVTVYGGHHRIFFLPGIISLFIMCVGIIWNNSFGGGRARAKVWTPAPERVTLYCTWRPSALTTRLHGQVRVHGQRKEKIHRGKHFRLWKHFTWPCSKTSNIHGELKRRPKFETVNKYAAGRMHSSSRGVTRRCGLLPKYFGHLFHTGLLLWWWWCVRMMTMNV